MRDKDVISHHSTLAVRVGCSQVCVPVAAAWEVPLVVPVQHKEHVRAQGTRQTSQAEPAPTSRTRP